MAEQLLKKIKIGTTDYIITDASVDGKISDYTYDKATIDTKDAADKTYADSKAATAESNAKADALAKYVSAVTQDSSDGHKLKVTKNGSTSTITIPDNNTTYTFAEGTADGKFTVTPSGGTTQSVAIHGLGTAAYKADTYFDRAGAAATAEANAKAYTYSQSSIDSKDASTLASAKEYADQKVAGGMHFRGTLGDGGTVSTLPSASATIVGDMYKVITAGTYASIAAKVGDVFICDSTPTWVLIPSGDEPSGTVTSVGITDGTGIKHTGGPITSSGNITVAIDDSVVATKTWSNNTFEPKFTDGSAAPASVNTSAGTITFNSVGQSGGKINTGSAITNATTYTKGQIDSLVAGAISHADAEDAKQKADEGGAHTHTVTGSTTVYKVNPTTKYMKATASNGAVGNNSTEYISAITPNTKYLVTDSKTVGCGNVTGVTYDTTASFAGFTTSYDESTGCLTFTAGTMSNVARNINVSTGTGISLTYATGAATSTTGTTASFISDLGTITKSEHNHSFTNPTIALSASGTSTDGPAYVQSVTDKTATESLSGGSAASAGAHGHTISKSTT